MSREFFKEEGARRVSRVLIACGGSGGHIFPALSFARALNSQNINTLLVLPKKARKSMINFDGCRAVYYSVEPVRLRLSARNLLAAFNLLKGSVEGLGHLIEFKPDVVMGFGGIESVPLVMAGCMLRLKTILHEQNVLPGKANRMLARFADKVALSFAETKEHLPVSSGKMVLTGSPLNPQIARIDRKEALGFFGLDENKFTLLVMGGSQGSRRVNQEAVKALEGFDKRSSVQVIHLTGAEDRKAVEDSYRQMKVAACVFDFLRPMHYAYSASDLAISRAGATSISELIFFGLPAILIPYPFAYQHQMQNALILKDKGCAEIVKDEDAERGSLSKAFSELAKDPARLRRMRESFRQLERKDANELLMKEVFSFS